MKIKDILTMLNMEDLNFINVQGNVEADIDGLNLCNRKSSRNRIMAYATSSKYYDLVLESKHIICMVVNEDCSSDYYSILKERNGCVLICDSPEVVFYKIHESLCASGTFYPGYDFDSKIGENCVIDKTAVIEKGVVIGNNVVIGPNTVVRSGSIIDDNVTIGCNTTIGSEGFQLITDSNKVTMHITHVGKCHICSNVYIGDNTCICNSLFEGETYIGQGAKIDNLVHIAHNLYVGSNAVITAHVITCGSSIIEDCAWIGPNSSILNRVVVGKGSKVGMGSVVTRDVPENTLVYGCPAKSHEKKVD